MFKVLRYSGLPYLFREFVQRKRLTILLYHNISRENADKTFPYLAEKYHIIGLQDYLQHRRERKPLPPKSLIITFDDGAKGNYDLLPLLKKTNLPVSIFLCAGIIDTTRHFWFTFSHPGFTSSELKQLSNREKLHVLKEAGFEPEKEQASRQALTKVQILEMSPFVDFQSHTLFHPCLPTCEDEEAREEIFRSKEILEEAYGFPINAFAFPNGDYSDRDIELIKEAGYECAITVDSGFNTLDTDPFRLKRMSVNDTGNIDELIVKASGLWWFFKKTNGAKRAIG